MSVPLDLRTHRIICLVYPLGASERVLLASNGSIEIIAAEQFLLMKNQLPESRLLLHDESNIPQRTDILLLLLPLPLAPIPLMERFERVVYFFDDLTIHKWRSDQSYAQRVSRLKAILHPLKAEAEELRRHTGKFSAHVPWSIARLPKDVPMKSARPSIFVDMDDRSVYADSLGSAVTFINAIRDVDADIFVPVRGLPHIPLNLRSRIEPIGFLPHDQFLRFLGSMWYYASGIRGSYEYVVLESARLGCGLISLFSAAKPEHENRSEFLAFGGEESFHAELTRSIARIDPSKISSEARVLYPDDATARIPIALGEAFQ